MMDKGEDQEQIDVRSVVEAVSADHSFGAPLYVVESMCMRCNENETSRFLLTLIPHFRKVVISAFECPHCGERNNEVQFAGEIQPRGCCYRLEVPAGDVKVELIFDREVVKSESATIKIPELNFEIPPEAQRGSLSTFNERTPEQQATLGNLADPSQDGQSEGGLGAPSASTTTSIPHGTIGATGGHRAIAQSNISDNLFRYSAPEESDTAGVKIPELDLELAGGTLGGMVTTVEGLVVTQIREKKSKGIRHLLPQLLSLEQPWTLILDDELAYSFISPVTDDMKDDHQLTYEEFERSWEQNEELGLNDIDNSSADAAYGSTETAKLP